MMWKSLSWLMGVLIPTKGKGGLAVTVTLLRECEEGKSWR
jgi:hypothetical protein